MLIFKVLINAHAKNQICSSGGYMHAIYIWAPSQYPKRRLSIRSRKVSKPRDSYLELSDRSEIWQALRQQCCRCACQISKRYDNLKYRSRGFETLRNLTERRLYGYWDGALLLSKHLWKYNTKTWITNNNVGLNCQNYSRSWFGLLSVKAIISDYIFFYHAGLTAPFQRVIILIMRAISAPKKNKMQVYFIFLTKFITTNLDILIQPISVNIHSISNYPLHGPLWNLHYIISNGIT